ncbi:MAG: matrixin family metalloprotease [Nanoarchaeota archaeon]|nr:matrixin family metalloprotease [Nanoarchaeota archaeon]
MKKGIILITLLLLFILGSIGIITASPEKKEKDKPFKLPDQAKELEPGIYDLGKSIHDGQVVDGIAFIDYKEENAKNNNNAKINGKTTCYNFLASGAKWKTLEPWIVNPSNTANLSESFITTNIAANLQKWENGAHKEIFSNGATTTQPLSADTTSPDGINEIYFGSITNPGVIAVTIVWGTFQGPTTQRKIIEWDQIYDQEDYRWSTTGEAGKMDFENIATHEIGHAAGLGHPTSTCTEETMYAYANYGETKKRDLNNGDITGIYNLYK